ncbi:MAG: hypothetical protein AB1Y26_04680 [Cycloclasticus sp.]
MSHYLVKVFETPKSPKSPVKRDSLMRIMRFSYDEQQELVPCSMGGHGTEP